MQINFEVAQAAMAVKQNISQPVCLM